MHYLNFSHGQWPRVVNTPGGLAVTTSDLHTEGAGLESICVHSGCGSVLVLRVLVVE